MSGPFNGYDYDHRHVCKWCGKQGYKTNTGYYNDNYCSEKCYEEKISSSSNSTNSSSGACFIATSVYGDYNHPIVLDLRQFRDNWLGKREKGQKFISWYYQKGPVLASWIDKSKTRKLFALSLIVKPLHFFVKLFRLHKR